MQLPTHQFCPHNCSSSAMFTAYSGKILPLLNLHLLLSPLHLCEEPLLLLMQIILIFDFTEAYCKKLSVLHYVVKSESLWVIQKVILFISRMPQLLYSKLRMCPINVIYYYNVKIQKSKYVGTEEIQCNTPMSGRKQK